jgi:N-acetylglucosamine-6-phosphate deacetylase
VPGVLGLHIEGPFLNEARRGVHDASKIRNLDEDAFRLLTSPTGGKTLITLAPEKTTPRMIRALTRAGVIVSAGHSDATYAQVQEALAAGLTGFTHLFNAMSQLTVREPGVVGAALEDENSWCSIIVDGHHVDPVVLRLALRIKRRDRFILVTDAMPTVGTTGKAFTLLGKQISVVNGVCIDQNGTLAGSDLNMASAIDNTLRLLRLDLPEAVRMASAYPAAFLRVSDSRGRIGSGFRADLVIAGDNLQVRDVWSGGLSGR